MKRESDIPTEFASLSGKIFYIRQISNDEWSGSCPYCGGSIHSDGELPDRFRMWTKSRATGGALGWCRVCGKTWNPNSKDNVAIDPATLALLAAQAAEAEAKRQAERKRKLAEFSTGELWEELHARMGEEQRAWWREAGVPDDWQDYLHLGWTDDKIYKSGDELCHSPAYTIPYFGYGWVFKTLQYRLTNPVRPQDRYRFEADLGTAYYMTTPNRPIGDSVVVCEGAKKGIVVAIWGKSGEGVTVLAVPSKVDWRSCGVLEAVKDCGRVWIWLDPDCYEPPADALAGWTPQPVLFAKAVGKNARVIESAVKADDAFLLYGMTDEEWKALKKQAVKL